jgi:hypothetical protein
MEGGPDSNQCGVRSCRSARSRDIARSRALTELAAEDAPRAPDELAALAARSYGAVEHYRPKSPVAGSPDHPGYYWLAYDPANYLPTCTRCNTGKSNFFPLVAGSPRATVDGVETSENPLLLNPCNLDSPTTHLAFIAAGSETKVGPVAKGLTEHGKESVRLLGLNRPDVLTERFNEQRRAAQDFLTQRLSGMRPIPVVEQLNAGIRPFSAAALAAVTFIDQGSPSLGG